MKNAEKLFLGICILLVLIGAVGSDWSNRQKETQIQLDKELFIQYYMEGHADGCIAGMDAVGKDSLDVYWRRAKEDSVKFVNSHPVK